MIPSYPVISSKATSMNAFYYLCCPLPQTFLYFRPRTCLQRWFSSSPKHHNHISNKTWLKVLNFLRPNPHFWLECTPHSYPQDRIWIHLLSHPIEDSAATFPINLPYKQKWWITIGMIDRLDKVLFKRISLPPFDKYNPNKLQSISFF